MIQFDAAKILTITGLMAVSLLAYVMVAVAAEPSKVPLHSPLVKVEKVAAAKVAGPYKARIRRR
jgi:hypothetical protein